MRQLAEKIGEKHIDECVCVGFESAIPQISDVCFESIEDITQWLSVYIITINTRRL